MQTFIEDHPLLAVSVCFSAGLSAGLLLQRIRLGLPLFRSTASASGGAGGDTATRLTGDYKMILVVRNDLKMGKGKIGAQCAHAAVGAVEKLAYENMAALRHWQRQGQPKVVVKVEDETDFFQILKCATSEGLNTCVISDAGRTQIAPGTKTVLAVGPGPIPKINAVTGRLKLM